MNHLEERHCQKEGMPEPVETPDVESSPDELSKSESEMSAELLENYEVDEKKLNMMIGMRLVTLQQKRIMQMSRQDQSQKHLQTCRTTRKLMRMKAKMIIIRRLVK